MTWMVSPRTQSQFYMERPWSYQTSPNFDHTYDDIRNLWKRPGQQYDFMRDTFMPALGLEGLYGLGATPAMNSALNSITTLPQIRDYASNKMMQAQSVVVLGTAQSAKDAAIKQYTDVVNWVNYDIANPPGGAWEPAEYAQKVNDLKTSLAYGDANFTAALNIKPSAPGSPAPSTPPVIPTQTSTTPPPATVPSNTMRNVGVVAAVAGVALVTYAFIGKPRTNPRRKRRKH